MRGLPTEDGRVELGHQVVEDRFIGGESLGVGRIVKALDVVLVFPSHFAALADPPSLQGQVVNIGGGATLMENGDFLGAYEDHEVARREIIRHCPADADAYDRFSTDMSKWCRFIRPFLLRTPPDPTSF
ncbi:MAG: hypothetical protein ABGY29_16805, partial [bacterium]